MITVKKASKKKIALLSVLMILLLTCLVIGVYTAAVFIKTGHVELKSEAQVYQDAAVLDADVSYLVKDRHIFKKISRLGYNKDAPIKVVLKDNLSPEQKEIINDTYNNTINPLFKIINDKYYFKVIDAKDFKKSHNDKVVIYFEHDDSLDTIWGAVAETYYPALKQNINPIFDKATIKLSTNAGKIAVLHEILHTFGLDDVVNQENYGTFLKYGAEHIAHYKPNDIKALAALYSYSVNDLTEWIEEYTREYYKNLAEKFTGGLFYDYVLIDNDDLDNDIIIDGGEGSAISDYFNSGLIWTQQVKVEVIDIDAFDGKKEFNGENDAFLLSFEITLENGLFEFIQKDKDGNIVYTLCGQYHHYKGKIFLGIAHTPIQGEIIKHNLVIINTADGYRLCSIREGLNNFFYSNEISSMTLEKLFLFEQ